MCLSKPKVPKPPPLPAPPPEPPKMQDEAVTKARNEQLKKARLAGGFSSTKLTSGSTAGRSDIMGKTALGQ